MARSFNGVPEDVLKEAANASEASGGKRLDNGQKPSKPQKGTPPSGGSKQRRIFKRTRAGVVLSREEVKEIKRGRKELRKDLRAKGIKSKREFELVAGSSGLYFDKRRGFLLWLLGHWLGLLIAAFIVLLLILFIFAAVTQLRGHFTVNLSGDMFREGFTLSETVGFEHPTTELFAQAAENVPCISIKAIPRDVDRIDGQHNAEYFAYTFYIRNEGESTVDYAWNLYINSESQDISESAWIMLFEDGVPRLYAAPNGATGEKECLPPKGDNTRGYINLQLAELAPETDQLEVIRSNGNITYYRIVPDNFADENNVAYGYQQSVDPMEVHKYTVVMWLEGDDVDTGNDKIGGHLGVQFDFRLAEEEFRSGEDGESGSSWWDRFWSNLAFWK